MATGFYRIGNIEIDASQRAVIRDGAIERPRQRVFELLLFLIEHHNQVVTKQELIENVWGGLAVGDSVLYKTILEARRALGDDTNEPKYIRTLHKSGYQFIGVLDEIVTDPPAMAPSIAPAIPAPPLRRNGWEPVALIAIAAGLSSWVYVATAHPTLPDLSDGEVAWWHFDEGKGTQVSDSVGKSHGRLFAGSRSGTLPRWTSGRAGGALELDGGGGYAEGPFSSQTLSSTITGWIQITEPPTSLEVVIETPRLHLYLDKGGRVLLGRPIPAIGTTERLDDHQWHHFALVDEGPLTNVGRVFIDGRESHSGGMPPLPKPAGSRWRVGDGSGGKGAFRGAVDDLRAYDRPLNAPEIEALYRCANAQPDPSTPGQLASYLLPIWVGADVAGDGSFTNRGRDFGGIQVARSDGSCGIQSQRGADLGQDVRISVDLLAPGDAKQQTEAGPYLRSRRAYAGDGVTGGTSSGYWVALGSRGGVTVWQLNPFHVVAESPARPGFDAGRFHHLEATARGTVLEIVLDGEAVEFESHGRTSRQTEIAVTAPGHGTTGVAFSAMSNRDLAGAQRARNLRVEALRK
jgi:DNA-binding winged helix-turn-helix (wHTH) protein